MSIVESLLLYNPLEALVLILFCDIFTKRKFKKTDIIHCYILGGINLFIQSIRYLFPDPLLMLVYDIIAVFVIGVFITYFYYFVFIGTKIRISRSFLAHIFNYTAMCFVAVIFNNIFNNVYTFQFSNKNYEFFTNISLRIFEIFIVLIIKIGVIFYEKYFKNYCKQKQ